MARIRRSEKTREMLLDQGINLLSEHGYHGTGLKLILDTVKVPKGSFYNYFASKEQFAAEILDTYADKLLTEYDSYAASSKEAPLMLIKHVYQSMIKAMEAEGFLKGCLLGNMAAEIGGHSEICRKSMVNTLDKWKQRIVTQLQAGQKRGEVRSDLSADILADLLWCAWEGGVLRMKIEGSAKTVQTTLNVLLDTVLVANHRTTQQVVT